MKYETPAQKRAREACKKHGIGEKMQFARAMQDARGKEIYFAGYGNPAMGYHYGVVEDREYRKLGEVEQLTALMEKCLDYVAIIGAKVL